MKVGIIGLGLIGGSLSLVLKKKGLADWVMGTDASPMHMDTAMQLGIVDQLVDINTLVKEADLVVLAIPVSAANKVLPEILDGINSRQVVIDMGSTKRNLLQQIQTHPNRGRFVATHPMWGTEFSGPQAASDAAFAGKAGIICNRHESDEDAIQLVENLLRQLGMHLLYMNADDHDIHTAYISHISHITSFALANTVLEKEREEQAIFELASAGFESTVRLAKSNPDTWLDIFKENKENVLDVLNEHITQLRKFKSCLEKENWDYLHQLMAHANEIKRILK